MKKIQMDGPANMYRVHRVLEKSVVVTTTSWNNAIVVTMTLT